MDFEFNHVFNSDSHKAYRNDGDALPLDVPTLLRTSKLGQTRNIAAEMEKVEQQRVAGREQERANLARAGYGGEQAVAVAEHLAPCFRKQNLSLASQDAILRAFNQLHDANLITLGPIGANSLLPLQGETLQNRAAYDKTSTYGDVETEELTWDISDAGQQSKTATAVRIADVFTQVEGTARLLGRCQVSYPRVAVRSLK